MANRGTFSIALLSIGFLCAGGDALAAGKKDKNKDKEASEKASQKAAEEAAAAEQDAEATEAEVVAPAPAVSESSAGFEKGFYISDGGVNKLHIGGRVQGRFEGTSFDRGTADRFNSYAFSVPRARIQLKGQTLTERLHYSFQADFGKGQVSLKDYYLDYHVGQGELRVRGGQFKKPFSRQQITSSGKQQFVDRSIVDEHFDNGRDLGLMVHNDFEKSPELEWAFGIFNGTGDKGVFVPDIDPMTMEVVGGSFSNVPVKVRPALVARVGHNASGIDGYSESDLERGPLRFSIAGAVMTHFQLGGAVASTRAGVDFAIKQEGVSVTGGLYADMQGPTIDDLSYAGVGAYTQVGYMLDKGYEPALRYAVIAEDGGNNSQEVSGVFSLYEFGHNFKWQTDVSLLANDDGAAKTKDFRGRSQIQLVF